MTYVPPRKHGNPWAIASIILGIFMCIPFITSGLAVIFGFIGLARGKYFGLRPLAVAGIVMGVLGIVFWGGVTGAIVSIFKTGGPFRTDTGSFVNQLVEGNVQGARAFADPTVTDAQLQHWSAQFRNYGALQSVSMNSFDYNMVNGVLTVTISGTLEFKTVKDVPFTATFQREGKVFKITHFEPKLPVGKGMSVTWSDIWWAQIAAA